MCEGTNDPTASTAHAEEAVEVASLTVAPRASMRRRRGCQPDPRSGALPGARRVPYDRGLHARPRLAPARSSDARGSRARRPRRARRPEGRVGRSKTAARVRRQDPAARRGNKWTYGARARRAAAGRPTRSRSSRRAQPQDDRHHREVGRRQKGARHAWSRSRRRSRPTSARTRRSPTLDERTLTTTITCNAKKFEISPDSFFFAGEPGGYYGLTLDKIERPQGHELEADERRPSARPSGARTSSCTGRARRRAGSEAKLGSGKLELERKFTPQQPESVITKVGSYTAEKLGLITTGRVTLDNASPDAKPMELPADWVDDAVARRRRRRRADAQRVRAHVPARPTSTAEVTAAPTLRLTKPLRARIARRSSVDLRPRARADRRGVAPGELVTIVDERRPDRDRVRRSGLADPRARARSRSATRHRRRRVGDVRAPRRRPRAARAIRCSSAAPAGASSTARPTRAPGSSSIAYADTAVVVFDGPAAAAFWRPRLADVLAGLERGGADDRARLAARRARRSARAARPCAATRRPRSRSPRTTRASRSTSAPARRPASSSISATTAARSAATPPARSVLNLFCVHRRVLAARRARRRAPA